MGQVTLLVVLFYTALQNTHGSVMGQKCVGVAEETVDRLHGYRIDYCVDTVP